MKIKIRVTIISPVYIVSRRTLDTLTIVVLSLYVMILSARTQHGLTMFVEWE